MVSDAVERMRESGRAYLRKHPGAFGGGIDPETGVRTSGGSRVSVAGEGEVAGQDGVPTLEQAQAISTAQTQQVKQAQAISTAQTQRVKIIQASQIQSIQSAQAQRIQLQKPIPQTIETTPTASGWLNKYQTIEKRVSIKLYDITKFSEEQHEKQRTKVIESGEFIQTKAEGVKSSFDAGGYSFLGTVAGGTLSIFGKTGTLIAGGVGYIAKKTMDKPITTPVKYAALGAAGYGAGLAVGGGGALIGGTSGAVATGGFGGGTSALVIPGVKIAGAALGASYVYGVGKDVKSAPTTFEQGGIITEAALEIGAVGGGYASGSQRATKIGDWWRTRGRTEYPVENYVIQDVLSGKTRFVESKSYGYTGKPGVAKQKFDISIFEKTYTGVGDKVKTDTKVFHATPETFWKDRGFTTQTGTSEFPGLYVAPSTSVHFAKTGTSNYKISLFGTGLETAGKPAVAEIRGLTFTKAPSKTGAAFVTGVKPEIEAVIPVGQLFGTIDKSAFFKYRGRRIPVDVFKKPVGTSTVGGTDLGVSLSGSISSGSYSTYSTPKYPIYSPITTSIGSLTSSTPSTSYSSSISTIAPSIISYTVPPQAPPISYIPPTLSSGGSSRGRGSSSYVPSPSPSSIVPSPSGIPSSPSGIPSSPSGIPSYSSGIPRYTSTSKVPTPLKIKFKPSKLPKQTGRFTVLGRRFGKFKPIGISKTESGAFGLGKDWARKTLGATFKIPKAKGRKLPGFRTKKSDGEIFYIEPKKKRLKKGGKETLEIQFYKSLKGGKK